MVKQIITIFLIALSVNAQTLLINSPTNTTLKTIDIRDFTKAIKAIKSNNEYDRMGVEDLIDYIKANQPISSTYPFLVDTTLKLGTPYTGNISNDLETIKQKDVERRPKNQKLKVKLNGKSRKEFETNTVDAVRNSNGLKEVREATADYLEYLTDLIEAQKEADMLGIQIESDGQLSNY